MGRQGTDCVSGAAADWPLYQGTKQLRAHPATKAAYCEIRGWTVPADEDPAEPGYIVEYTEGGKPNVDGYSGYVSWSPADVFERTYSQVDGRFSFGEAIQRLKLGKPVTRVGWNGPGMFVYMVPAASYPAQTGVAKECFGEDAMVPYRAYLALKTTNGDIATWAPSCSDALADDWVEVGLIRPV